MQRIPFLKQKFGEPLIQQRMVTDKWDVITYDSIEKLMSKKSITMKDIEDTKLDLTKELKMHPIQQKKLSK
jgi:hypothetical protein